MITHIVSSNYLTDTNAWHTLVGVVVSTDPPSDCTQNCLILSRPGSDNFPAFYGWLASEDMSNNDVSAESTREATMTIVTVVNTVLNHTSITTITPPDDTRNQPTDDRGTAIQVISYTRGGKNLTTTM